jgi:hypothetical protein
MRLIVWPGRDFDRGKKQSQASDNAAVSGVELLGLYQEPLELILAYVEPAGPRL